MEITQVKEGTSVYDKKKNRRPLKCSESDPGLQFGFTDLRIRIQKKIFMDPKHPH
jgi:hypothetical protein